MAVSTPRVSIAGLAGIPEIEEGGDLARLIVTAVRSGGLHVERGDVVVCTQKIVSKSEGRLVQLDDVTPRAEAREWAERWNRDARVIELVLREARRIVRMERGVVITETHHGLICANSGVDTSNVAAGWAALLPQDPDLSARRLCAALRSAFGVPIGVIVSDTFGRPWREGQTNVAIGVAGMRPIVDYRGTVDVHGQVLHSTAIAAADELASAAELVMRKTLGVPVAIVSGTGMGTAEVEEGSGRELLRRPDEDLFR